MYHPANVTSPFPSGTACVGLILKTYSRQNWMEGIKKAMNERNLYEGQWEDRKQWSLGVGQRRKTF